MSAPKSISASSRKSPVGRTARKSIKFDGDEEPEGFEEEIKEEIEGSEELVVVPKSKRSKEIQELASYEEEKEEMEQIREEQEKALRAEERRSTKRAEELRKLAEEEENDAELARETRKSLEKLDEKSKSRSKSRSKPTTPPVAKKGSRSPKGAVVGRQGRKSPRRSPRKSPIRTTLPLRRSSEGDGEAMEDIGKTPPKTKSKSPRRSPIETETTISEFPVNQTMKEIYFLPMLIAADRFKNIDDRVYVDRNGQPTARLILVGDEALAFYDQEDQKAYSSGIKELSERSNGPYMYLLYLTDTAGRKKTLARANILNAGRIIAETFANYLNEYRLQISQIDNRLQERCRCTLEEEDRNIFSMEYDEEDDPNLFAIVYNTQSKSKSRSSTPKRHIFATFRLYDPYEEGNPPTPNAVVYENRYIASLGYIISQANWGSKNAASNSMKKMYKRELDIATRILDSGKLSCASINSSCATCYDENQQASTDSLNKETIVDNLIARGYYPPQARDALIEKADIKSILRSVRRVDNTLIK